MIAKGLHIGPSPNWYLINVSDCNSDHIFAYGAKTNICLIDVATLPPTYVGLFPAHAERVSILKFCRNFKHPNLLVSGADDGKVKVWDIQSNKCLNEISVNQKITCIEWQGSREDTVFLSYDQGLLVLWKIDTESATPIKTSIKCGISVLSSCPHNSNLLGIGYRGGLIAIMDIELGTITQKLKGHENDVLSLSWNPLAPESKESDARAQIFSTSRDKTMRVWDVEQERARHVLQVPAQQISFMRRDELKMRFFVSGTWLPSSSHQILVGFPNGDLCTLDLEDGSQTWEPFTAYEVGGHSRCIFNISLTPDGKKAFTISLDRQIVIWDLENRKALYSLATLGGFAYSLGFSPLERGRLAIGGGDNNLRIWNLTSSTKSCTTYWQGIKGKVTTLAWHPSKEGIIAFGTDEGRIGFLDTNSNKAPSCSSTFHRNTVYSIRWGPYLFKENGSPLEEVPVNQPLDLYSCGDGHIFIHLTNNLQSEAKNFDHLVKKYVDHQNRPLQRTELAWKQDFAALAVGNEDGSIEIYSKKMVLLARLEGPKKLIQCLCWHPMYTGASDQLSSLHGWLACASNETTIYIYDLAPYIADKSENFIDEKGEEAVVVTEATRELVGHHFRVVALVWSPHDDGDKALLASASYDATVQVWDAYASEPIANYQGHKGRLFCVEWSPLDPDVVFSGGEDSTVQQWRISECTSKIPPLKEKSKSKKATTIIKSTEQLELEALLDQKKKEILGHQFGPGGDHPEVVANESSGMLIANGGTGDCMPVDKISEEENENQKSSLSDDQACIQPVKETKLTFTKSTKQTKFKKTDATNETKKTKKKTQKSYFPLTSNMDCSGKHRGQEDCIYLLNFFYPPKVESKPAKSSKKTSRKVSFSDAKSLMEEKPSGSHTSEVQGMHNQASVCFDKSSQETTYNLQDDDEFILSKEFNDSIASSCSQETLPLHKSSAIFKLVNSSPSKSMVSDKDGFEEKENQGRGDYNLGEASPEPKNFNDEKLYTFGGPSTPNSSCDLEELGSPTDERSTIVLNSASHKETNSASNDLSIYSSSTTSLNTTQSDVEPSITVLLEEMLNYVTQTCPEEAFPNEVEQGVPPPKRRPRLVRKSLPSALKATVTAAPLSNQSSNVASGNHLVSPPQPNLGFFTNNMSARKVLSIEATHHRDNSNFDYYSQMEIWQGNIGNVLREAADQKKLNDVLVSLAPLGSNKLWREMCEAYAQQLASEGNYHKAALYLLACHHVHKAVQLFKSHGLYREAVALARARLSATDHVLHDLYLAWGNHADKEGNYELAAKCYLTINLPVAASKVLAKRNDPSSIRVAALIARRCGQTDKAGMYAHAALRDALLKGEMDLAKEVTQEHPGMEGFTLLIDIHSQILTQYECLRNVNLEGGPECLLNANYWKEFQFEEEEEKFLESILHKWQEAGGSTSHLSSKMIKSLPLKNPHLRNVKEALLKVSLDLFQEIVNSIQ